MSQLFIDKSDSQIVELIERLKAANSLLKKVKDTVKPTLCGEQFLTDEELSAILKVSRRTLQEYRSARVIPYYLIQGKALYKESEIAKILEDAHKKCVDEQQWV